MTVINSENNAETSVKTEKVDTNMVQHNPDTNIAQDDQQSQVENSSADSQEDPNWRAFREGRKKDRAEREAAEKKAREKEEEVNALKAAMEAAFSKSAPTPQAYDQYYGMNSNYQDSEDEDTKIEKKVNAILKQREEQSRIESLEREQREYPNRLMREFPDFNHVISQEHLDYIDYHYPEISRPLNRLPDGYDKWSDIYKAVKKFVPNVSNSKKEGMKADINQNKPKSISSVGLTPSGESSRDSYVDVEQRRAANWERMRKMMQGV